MKKLILLLFIVLLSCCEPSKVRQYTLYVTFENNVSDTIKVISRQPPYIGGHSKQLMDGHTGYYLTGNRVSYFSVIKREIINN